MKKRVLNICIALVILTFIFVSVAIYFVSFKYFHATAIYTDMKERAVTATVPESSTEVVDELLQIDFDLLIESNHDICSWLDIPGTKISYPIVQGIDNETYLDYDAYGNSSTLGSLYLNFNNSSNLSDSKSIIYGHNMRNGTMFHDLRYYDTLSYGKEHNHAYIYLPDGSYKKYNVLCSGLVDPLDLSIYALHDEETIFTITDYLQSVSDTIYNEVSDGNILILSTCSNDSSKRRIVVFQEI